MKLDNTKLDNAVDSALKFEGLGLNYDQLRHLENMHRRSIKRTIMMLVLKEGQTWTKETGGFGIRETTDVKIIALTNDHQVVYRYENQHGIKICLVESDSHFVEGFSLKEDV